MKTIPSALGSTEFWLTVLTIVLVSLLLFLGKVTEDNWMLIIGGLVAWWTGARTLLKMKSIGNGGGTYADTDKKDNL